MCGERVCVGVGVGPGASGPLTLRELRAAGCSAAQLRTVRACTAEALLEKLPLKHDLMHCGR